MSAPSVQVLQGDALEMLRTLPDESVHTCITSPPYYLLRDYGVPGQIGLEATPEEYIQTLVLVFRELRRVLRSDGTLWLNMGDSYNAYNGGAGPNDGDISLTQSRVRPRLQTGYGLQAPALKPKDLMGMPWRVAFALQADGWWLRSDIIWEKPTCMPESVRDRPTRAHEYIFLLARAERYYYDAAAIAEPVTGRAHDRESGVNPKTGKIPSGWNTSEGGHHTIVGRYRPRQNPSFSAAVHSLVERRNKRTVWKVASEGYPGAHFATFPQALVEPCVLAGSPAGGTVLDPFAGSGTTLAVALKHGRSAIGIELNPEYVALCHKRLSGVTLPLPLGEEACS